MSKKSDLNNSIEGLLIQLHGKLSEYRMKLFRSIFFALSGALTGYVLVTYVPAAHEYEMYIQTISIGLVIYFLVLAFPFFNSYWTYRKINSEFVRTGGDYKRLLRSENIDAHGNAIIDIKRKLNNQQTALLEKHYKDYLKRISVNKKYLEHRKNMKELKGEYESLIAENELNFESRVESHPLIVAQKTIVEALAALKLRREELWEQWNIAKENFSWWKQLTDTTEFKTTELDDRISELELMLEKFENKYGADINNIPKEQEALFQKSVLRINEAYRIADTLINQKDFKSDQFDGLLQKATWCSILSVPISVTGDFIDAHNIYDSLRKVNGNFQNMTDPEIWWETVWMRDESLVSLASLTKGAYFEQLVAEDTGGELFGHFNHPGTDITIDGVEFQIKATDSATYIASVDKDIPIIATSEVALRTGVIDGGYSNEEISKSVDLAIGGSVVDYLDTAIDAILAGLGGLGIFATMNGMNYAAEKYNKGGDGVEAIFEGAGIAIEGTAKGLVDVSEFTYKKVVMSRPSRFVGRSIAKAAVKLDKKLFDE